MSSPVRSLKAKPLQSLARGLSVLEAFANREEISLNEIIARVRLPKTTVFRILQTLENLGHVDRTGDAAYRLGVRALNIGRNGQITQRLRRVAQPHLHKLLERLGETVNLGVLDGAQVLYLAVLESPSSLRVSEKPGSHSPLHASAMGKCLVADLPEAEISRLLDALKMDRYTDRTLTTPAELRRELIRVKARRMAADAEESEVHAVCMAVPVSDETGRVVGAVSVTGPKNRLLGIGIDRVVKELLHTGDQITSSMDGRCTEGRPSAQNLAAQMLRQFRQSQ